MSIIETSTPIPNSAKAKDTKIGEEKSERDERRARGEVTNKEMDEYWESPDQLFFMHELAVETKSGKEIRTVFSLGGLTDKNTQKLLEETRSAWGPVTLPAYERALATFFSTYRQAKTKPDYSLEYYAVADQNDVPYAVAGIYTEDNRGTRGFKNRNMLDADKHNLIACGGWAAVSGKREYRATGIGSRFLFPWIERMAKARGARIIKAECDDAPNESVARKSYEKMGLSAGFDVDDYFGPGRDLRTYYKNISNERESVANISDEKINRGNAEAILELGRKIFSPERFEELEVCLKQLLDKYERINEIPTILHREIPESFVVRNAEGQVVNFAILKKMIYDNSMEVL